MVNVMGFMKEVKDGEWRMENGRQIEVWLSHYEALNHDYEPIGV